MTNDKEINMGEVQVAAATRRGVREFNCDAAATFASAEGAVVGAVVDGIGNSEAVAAMAAVAAQVIARVAGRRGVLPALLTAGEVISDPGADNDSPDAVAVVAILQPGEETRVGWVGDSRAYGYDGKRLRQYSTDQTVGEQLRRNGVPVEVASKHDNWLKASLAGATVGTVYTAYVPEEEMVVVCSDGVVDGLPPGRLEELVEQHAEDPQALADAVVGAAEANERGYRDDATIVVLRPARSSQERDSGERL